MESVCKRFGERSDAEINVDIGRNVPENTRKSRESVWRQFSQFLEEKDYSLTPSVTSAELNIILKSWAVNMRKRDGSEYKEGVVKHLWNSTAKMVQEMYFNMWNIEINPFSEAVFKTSREARDATRRKLQALPEERTSSAVALSEKEYQKIVEVFDEDSPHGLQKKFFFIVSYELAWRGGEEEINNEGLPTGRVEYNSIFSKTAQGGAKRLTESNWLITNENAEICPIRLYHKLLSKRGSNVKTERMFLTPNPFWNSNGKNYWYKNSPVGVNEIGKWVKTSAEKIGLDTKKRKISNHSIRSTSVSSLAKAGVGEHQLIKITGHNNINSIKSYLQMDNEHHRTIVEKMRTTTSTTVATELPNSREGKICDVEHSFKEGIFQNCNNVHFSNCSVNFVTK